MHYRPYLPLSFFLYPQRFWLSTPKPTRPVKEGEVDNQEITVEKSRKIELPPANRLFNKIPSIKPSAEQRKLTYEFEDRKLTVGDPRLCPVCYRLLRLQADETPRLQQLRKVGRR